MSDYDILREKRMLDQMFPSNSKKFKRAVKSFLDYGGVYYTLALLTLVTGSIIIEILVPTPATGFNWTWEGISMFLAVCAGVGWIIHGTGFLLVKVR